LSAARITSKTGKPFFLIVEIYALILQKASAPCMVLKGGKVAKPGDLVEFSFTVDLLKVSNISNENLSFFEELFLTKGIFTPFFR